MIKINRVNSTVDHNTKYKVYIDSIAVMEIFTGQIRDINIKAGKHKIQVKSEFFKSNIISFDYAEDEIIEFEVKPDYDDNGFSKFVTKYIFGKQGILISIKSDIYL